MQVEYADHHAREQLGHAELAPLRPDAPQHRQRPLLLGHPGGQSGHDDETGAQQRDRPDQHQAELRRGEVLLHARGDPFRCLDQHAGAQPVRMLGRERFRIDPVAQLDLDLREPPGPAGDPLQRRQRDDPDRFASQRRSLGDAHHG